MRCLYVKKISKYDYGKKLLDGKDLKGLFLTCFSHIELCVSADRLGPVIRQDCALSNGKGSVVVLFLYQKAESHIF